MIEEDGDEQMEDTNDQPEINQEDVEVEEQGDDDDQADMGIEGME